MKRSFTRILLALLAVALTACGAWADDIDWPANAKDNYAVTKTGVAVIISNEITLNAKGSNLLLSTEGDANWRNAPTTANGKVENKSHAFFELNGGTNWTYNIDTDISSWSFDLDTVKSLVSGDRNSTAIRFVTSFEVNPTFAKAVSAELLTNTLSTGSTAITKVIKTEWEAIKKMSDDHKLTKNANEQKSYGWVALELTVNHKLELTGPTTTAETSVTAGTAIPYTVATAKINENVLDFTSGTKWALTVLAKKSDAADFAENTTDFTISNIAATDDGMTFSLTPKAAGTWNLKLKLANTDAPQLTKVVEVSGALTVAAAPASNNTNNNTDTTDNTEKTEESAAEKNEAALEALKDGTNDDAVDAAEEALEKSGITVELEPEELADLVKNIQKAEEDADYEDEKNEVKDPTVPAGSDLPVSSTLETLNDALSVQPKVVTPDAMSTEEAETLKATLAGDTLTDTEKALLEEAGFNADDVKTENDITIEEASKSLTDQAKMVEDLYNAIGDDLTKMTSGGATNGVVIATVMPSFTPRVAGRFPMKVNLRQLVPGRRIRFWRSMEEFQAAVRASSIVSLAEDTKETIFLDKDNKPTTTVKGDASEMTAMPYLEANVKYDSAFITADATEEDAAALNKSAATEEDTTPQTPTTTKGSSSGCSAGFGGMAAFLALALAVRKARR